jgi:hypothetical protein
VFTRRRGYNTRVLDSETAVEAPRSNEPESEGVQDAAHQDNRVDDDVFVITFNWRRVVIGSFITWQIFAILVWLTPPGGIVSTYVTPAVAYYMEFTGCWQQWTMFSPTPWKVNDYDVA